MGGWNFFPYNKFYAKRHIYPTYHHFWWEEVRTYNTVLCRVQHFDMKVYRAERTHPPLAINFKTVCNSLLPSASGTITRSTWMKVTTLRTLSYLLWSTMTMPGVTQGMNTTRSFLKRKSWQPSFLRRRRRRRRKEGALVVRRRSAPGDRKSTFRLSSGSVSGLSFSFSLEQVRNSTSPKSRWLLNHL